MWSLTLGVFIRNVEGGIVNTGLWTRCLRKQHQAVISQIRHFLRPHPGRGSSFPRGTGAAGQGHITAWTWGRTHRLTSPILHHPWPGRWFRVCIRDHGCDGNEESGSYQRCLGACTGSSSAFRAVVLLHQGSCLLFKQAFSLKCLGRCISRCIVLHVASHFRVKLIIYPVKAVNMIARSETHTKNAAAERKHHEEDNPNICTTPSSSPLGGPGHACCGLQQLLPIPSCYRSLSPHSHIFSCAGNSQVNPGNWKELTLHLYRSVITVISLLPANATGSNLCYFSERRFWSHFIFHCLLFLCMMLLLSYVHFLKRFWFIYCLSSYVLFPVFCTFLFISVPNHLKSLLKSG